MKPIKVIKKETAVDGIRGKVLYEVYTNMAGMTHSTLTYMELTTLKREIEKALEIPDL